MTPPAPDSDLIDPPAVETSKVPESATPLLAAIEFAADSNKVEPEPIVVEPA